ncbi:carbohydrate-responsive element-binding protein-like [Oncorhynchus nerka]|uniref:carbohydrate-responsive element-binding protein-like n=1 Tax=Oncorhynchus nerka TaxID=8023 RepID=UPI0031B88604
MPEEVHMFDLGCFLSDISDTLFTITQKPCPGAKDRHNTLPWSQGPTQQCVPHHMFDLGCFLSDIADTLFTMTQKPCPGANDRHNSEYHTTCLTWAASCPTSLTPCSP